MQINKNKNYFKEIIVYNTLKEINKYWRNKTKVVYWIPI